MPSAAQYTDQLQAMLPPGLAWPRQGDTTLATLLDALAAEMARLDARAINATTESYAPQTTELLVDWERVCGLPGLCENIFQSLQERRDAVASRLAQSGGQSRAYFIALAQGISYEVTIDEFRPLSCIGHCDDFLNGGDWIYTWRVNAPETTIRYATCGESGCNDFLATWGNELLECTLDQFRPAHTILIFGYGGE